MFFMDKNYTQELYDSCKVCVFQIINQSLSVVTKKYATSNCRKGNFANFCYMLYKDFLHIDGFVI